MYKTFAKSCLVAATVSLFLGCSVKSPFQQSYSDNSVDKENQKVQLTKQHIEVANDMQQNVTTQYTLEGTINSLATQMMQNQKMSTSKPVLITSFVRLDNFKKTTEFGRVVSESLINEMSNRGFNIIEYRGQMAVSINERGEYFITRNPHKLKDKIPNTYVVVGTYSRQYGKVMLNARVMDNITGKIISSARATFQHNRRNDCILFKDCKPARTIKIIEEK
ncbi:FlgO family outer membrane protein [Halarcobacter sp.]|uniref:FlgO family outer membrane protein n=1 Tax=Halarcobacter sp. TaxID=2321133 RepID=UPI002AA60EF6|nr:FlgO family outer membrane protein [Halarcobacter sp.]